MIRSFLNSGVPRRSESSGIESAADEKCSRRVRLSMTRLGRKQRKMVHCVLTLLTSVQPRLNLGGHAGLRRRARGQQI
jgi:hypothetical protein